MSEQEIVKKALREMVDSFYRVQAERDLQQSVVQKIRDETETDPKLFRKLASTISRGQLEDATNEATTLLDLFEMAKDNNFYA